MTNTKIQPVEWFRLIHREVQNIASDTLKELKPWEVIFLFWESGVGKSVIMDELHKEFSSYEDKSDFFSWEGKNNIDTPQSGILEFLKPYDILDFATIQIIVNNSISHITNSTLSNVSQSVNINPFQEKMSPEQIQSIIYWAFISYNKPYIFFDAVEDLLSTGKDIENNDREIFHRVIKILVDKKVTIILSARNHKALQKIVPLYYPIEVEKFDSIEVTTYIQTNFSWLSQEHEWFIKDVCKYIDSWREERYDPISLSLLYTLYIEDKDDFLFLADDSEIHDLFELWKKSTAEWEFNEEVKILLHKKILKKNSSLFEYLKKNFLLKYHNRDRILNYTISVSDSEWNTFTHFISINGRVERNIKSKEKVLIIHDSIYHLTVSFFQDQLKTKIEDYEDNMIGYFNIFSDWCKNRLELGISSTIVIHTHEICHTVLEKTIPQDIYANFLWSFWTALYKIWNYSEGIKKYEDALITFHKIQQLVLDDNSIKNEMAWVYLNLGVIYRSTWNYQKSIKNYEKTLKMLLELQQFDSDNDRIENEIAWVYLNLGVVYSDIWNSSNAIQNYETALSIFLKSKIYTPNNDTLTRGIIWVYLNLGVVYSDLGNYPMAINKYYEALNEYKQLQVNTSNHDSCINLTATVHLNLGVSHRNTWSYQDAIDHYYEALKSFQHLLIDDPNNDSIKNHVAIANSNIGIVLMSTWNYQEAIKYYHEALDIRLNFQYHDPNNYLQKNEIATICLNLGGALRNTWNHAEAIRNYQKALDIYSQIQQQEPTNDSIKDKIAWVYINLGVSIRATWKPKEAIENYQKALTILYEILQLTTKNDSLKNRIATLYMNLGVASDDLWNFQEAIKYYQESLDIYSQLQLHALNNYSLNNEIGIVYLNLGVSLMSTWNFQEAIKYYQESLNIYSQLRHHDPYNDSYKNEVATLYINQWVAYIQSELWKKWIVSIISGLIIYQELHKKYPDNHIFLQQIEQIEWLLIELNKEK